jgi:prepilin-type N-terminal cleavage/methylation domain-containing protein
MLPSLLGDATISVAMNVTRAKKRNNGFEGFGRRGFSLVEMLVVLALLVVMVVIMTDRNRGSYQQQRMAMCEKNLQTMFVALSMYADDFNGKFPVSTNAVTSEDPLSLLIPRYTAVTEIFVCPGSKDPAIPAGEKFAKHKISYAYYLGWKKTEAPTQPLITDEQVDTTSKRPGAQIFSLDGKGRGSNHSRYGGNIMQIDGGIAAVKAKGNVALSFPTNISLLNPRTK